MIREYFQYAVIMAVITVSQADAGEVTITLDSIDVEDGDTLVIEFHGKNERLQLANIDAPEDVDNPKLQRDIQRTGLSGEKLLELGRRATNAMHSIVEAGGPYIVTFDQDARDRYGRLVGEVSSSKHTVFSAEMVNRGYAMVVKPKNGMDSEQLQAIESEAVDKHRGLWGGDLRSDAIAWSGKTSK